MLSLYSIDNQVAQHELLLLASEVVGSIPKPKKCLGDDLMNLT